MWITRDKRDKDENVRYTHAIWTVFPILIEGEWKADLDFGSDEDEFLDIPEEVASAILGRSIKPGSGPYKVTEIQFSKRKSTKKKVPRKVKVK